MALGVWLFRLIVLLYHVAAQKTHGTSALTSDCGHGLGSALSQNSTCEDTAASFLSPSCDNCLLHICSKELLGQVQETFILERNYWQLE